MKRTAFRLITFMVALSALALLSCGDDNPPTGTVTSDNPKPAIASLIPSQLAVGAASRLLDVKGSGFVKESIIRFDEVDRETDYESDSLLTTMLDSTVLATGDTIQVSVSNPEPGGGISGSLSFRVTPLNPIPIVLSIQPSIAPVGGDAFELVIQGSALLANSVVRWNGSDRPTVYRGPEEIVASIPPSDIDTSQVVMITVRNPGPGGGVSRDIPFEVGGENPPPKIWSISPSFGILGGPALSLELFGQNFVPSSVIRWNGEDRVTAWRNPTQLTALLRASDFFATDTVEISVFTPEPGGGTSETFFFRILSVNPQPDLFGMEPARIDAGYDRTLFLWVSGGNFIPESVVQWNRKDQPTRLDPESGRLRADIPPEDLAEPGTAIIRVFNPWPGGGYSREAVFVIDSVDTGGTTP